MDTWLEFLMKEFKKPYMKQLTKKLDRQYRVNKILPRKSQVLRAFQETPLKDVKVVILGQDPYPDPKMPNGLAFSVSKTTLKHPQSLKNIFKELTNCTDIPTPRHGDLSAWSRQGVLLLNSCLTVQANKPASHSNWGWEDLTDEAIRVCDRAHPQRPIIFVLWGIKAQKKANLIDKKKNVILKAPHPSPLSASRGFFGCAHFRKINSHLEASGQKPIDWRIR